MGSEACSLRRTARTKPLPAIRVNLSACKYEVLRLVAAQLGWQIVGKGYTTSGDAEGEWEVRVTRDPALVTCTHGR